jgi:hypothetical protein
LEKEPSDCSIRSRKVSRSIASDVIPALACAIKESNASRSEASAGRMTKLMILCRISQLEVAG